jgi:hypothetical protein
MRLSNHASEPSLSVQHASLLLYNKLDRCCAYVYDGSATAFQSVNIGLATTPKPPMHLNTVAEKKFLQTERLTMFMRGRANRHSQSLRNFVLADSRMRFDTLGSSDHN